MPTSNVSPVPLFLILLLLSSGCTTSTKYKMTQYPGRPIPMDLVATTGRVSGTLHTVIFFRGPGTWKEKALWDEYLISIENLGSKAVTISRAELLDILETDITPGTDPWELEKLSEENWKHYGENGLSLAMGSLAVVAGSALLASMAYLGGSASAGAGLAVMPVLIVGNIAYVQYANNSNANRVEAEFERRDLDFPLTIQAGSSVSGALFFPQAPGPKELKLLDESGEIILIFDLRETGLSTLHLEVSNDE